MAVMRNTLEPIIPRKRVFEEDNCEVEELKEEKLVASKPKIRFGVQVIRDFPPGCGIIHESHGSKADRERVPLKNLGNIDSKHRKITSNDDDNEHKSLKHKELGIQKGGFGLRPPGKVKIWDPNCSVAEKSNETTSLKSEKLGIQKPEFDSRPPRKIKKPGYPVAEKSNETTASLKPKGSRIEKPGFGSRPPDKVKFWDPSCSVDLKSNETTTSLRVKELGMQKPGFGSRPPGKVKYWDPSSVDEKSNETTTSLIPKESRMQKSGFGSRPPGKVKFWDASCSVDEKSNETTTVLSQKEQVRREKINEAMTMFIEVYEKLYLENKSKVKGEKIAHWRVPIEAAKIVKERMKWIHADKILGPVCGVQVGDKFRYRSQLQMVGLHCQPQSGIDYTKIGGKNLAISIVDSNRYSNQRQSCDELYYSGQGGVSILGGKQALPEDQKLERGNLALINSKNEKNLVRVVRKVHEVGKSSEVFVYDGLYVVEDCTQKKGQGGKMVFMFQLKRVPGQPQLHKMLKC